MRTERIIDAFAALLIVVGLALALVPVSVSYEVVLPGGAVTATASCGPPLRAAFGQGIEADASAVDRPGSLPAGFGQEQLDQANEAAAGNACRGTGALYLALGSVAVLAGAGWAGVRRHRATAPARAARQAAWRAANPQAEERPLVRPGVPNEADWDEHDESFAADRDGDFDGALLGIDDRAADAAEETGDPDGPAGPPGEAAPGAGEALPPGAEPS